MLASAIMFTGAPVGADGYGCDDWDYATVTIMGSLYIDLRFRVSIPDDDTKHDVALFIYQETNGQPNLQRGDQGDTCVESSDPDTILI